MGVEGWGGPVERLHRRVVVGSQRVCHETETIRQQLGKGSEGRRRQVTTIVVLGRRGGIHSKGRWHHGIKARSQRESVCSSMRTRRQNSDVACGIPMTR
jgi:hypothetical protein